VTRLFAVEDELTAAKGEIHRLAQTLSHTCRAGDLAQALMDLGATICTPMKPACALCPWADACAARRRGDQESFPRKTPKREGRLRRGAAFVAVRADGRVLLRTRPTKGLLGGMSEVPTTEWSHEFDQSIALVHAPRFRRVRTQWRRVPGVVTHVFTHFSLELVVHLGRVPKDATAPDGARWTPITALSDEALPNVMRKVLAHAFEFRKAGALTSP
jgi:A/G-specific adenine glycosylase